MKHRYQVPVGNADGTLSISYTFGATDLTAAGAGKMAWEKVAKANAGYKVLVRYSRDGEVVAIKTVKAGKTSATVKGLKPGKRAWVQVRPLRKAGGAVYAGALARAKSSVKVVGKSNVKAQSAATLAAAAI